MLIESWKIKDTILGSENIGNLNINFHSKFNQILISLKWYFNECALQYHEYTIMYIIMYKMYSIQCTFLTIYDAHIYY